MINLTITGNEIGYMPQQLSLLLYLTIEEILQYYGQLNRMTLNTIFERTNKFLSMFDINDKNRIVANLSGGQQKRLSLIIVMFFKLTSDKVLDNTILDAELYQSEYLISFFVAPGLLAAAGQLDSRSS